jgi:hypothetical protein
MGNSKLSLREEVDDDILGVRNAIRGQSLLIRWTSCQGLAIQIQPRVEEFASHSSISLDSYATVSGTRLRRTSSSSSSTTCQGKKTTSSSYFTTIWRYMAVKYIQEKVPGLQKRCDFLIFNGN